MITESTIYWATRLDGICTWLTVMIVVFAIVSVICVVVTIPCIAQADDDKEAKVIIGYGVKIFFPLFGIVVLLSVARVFTPTTAEFAMIKVLPAVCSSEFVSETIPKDAKTLYTLGIKAFEDKLKKLVPQEPKKGNQ